MRFRQGKLSTLAPPLPVVPIATRTSATITTIIQITVQLSPALTMMKCHTIQGSTYTIPAFCWRKESTTPEILSKIL